MILENCAAKLPCWENIRERYRRWKDFMERQVVFSLSGSSLHTKNHCARVLLYALTIGDKLVLADKDMDALGAAAVFHDSRRQDDWMDVGHGQRAADYYRDYCHENQRPMDARTFFIMAFHDRDDELGIAKIEESRVENGILLYRIFKDSDGLDRYRLGLNALDVDMLRTRPARTLVKFAQQLSG